MAAPHTVGEDYKYGEEDDEAQGLRRVWQNKWKRVHGRVKNPPSD